MLDATKIKGKAWKLFPCNFMCHYTVASILEDDYPDAEDVLDVGGIGRLEAFTEKHVVDANIKNGVDGQALPYKDNCFDTVVSVNTLEHVEHKIKFIKEARRVAKLGCILCFPFDGAMVKTEVFKKAMGHRHPMPWGLPRLDQILSKFPHKKLSYIMPSWLHIALVAGIKRLSVPINNEINMQLVKDDVWFTSQEKACSVVIDFVV